MPPSPAPNPSSLIRFLQGATIMTLAAAGGLNAGLTLLVIPRLREAPTPVLLRQFHAMVSRAFALFPAPLLLPGLAHLWLACRGAPQRRGLYGAAAALSLSISPWTWGVMMPLNRRLERLVAALDAGVGVREGGGVVGEGQGRERVEKEGEGEGEEMVRALIDKWAMRHLYRPTVTLLAGCLGLYAALS
ncbi:hypothetical protein F4779DRAFT_77539 [Xylariaceae sp. FL0662B]|nr:hypothetical protein F4779DRAFT_77539 [Xylariaceae sp. FL0662B]